MTLTTVVVFTLGSIASIGLAAGGLGYLISLVKKGSIEQKSDVITSADQLSTFWKEQADGYKAMSEKEKENGIIREKDWNQKFTDLTKEVGEIKGQLIEKEKQANMYLEILQNRDPEMKKFMEIMIKAAQDQTLVNSEIVRILGEIHSTVTSEQDKNLQVISTVTKQ